MKARKLLALFAGLVLTLHAPSVSGQQSPGPEKSYLTPALEIPGFLLLLNGFDRLAYPDASENGVLTYDSSLSTLWDHLAHGRWGVDKDAFDVNQFMHPYQGSMYHGFARSAGLDFWESLLYTSAGSFLWEIGGETTHPSINDQFASGIGGSFLGEALFRMAGLVLEGDGGKPGFWRELGATILSPPTGINRLAFGDRFAAVFPSRDPATFWQLRLGVSQNYDLTDYAGTSTVSRNEVTADFSLSYGLPGKPGSTYTRAFDYFHFEMASVSNTQSYFDNIMTRGLLLGKDYQAGASCRGIWGLYGGYDYISPRIFRVSSTSVSLGTTLQWWPAQSVALQGTALGGIGYAAAGIGAQVGERDYHFGYAAQWLLALRVILGERVMIDVTGRAYDLTDSGGGDAGGKEAIYRMNTGLTVRVYGRHALGVQYIASIRDAQYPERDGSHQRIGTLSLVYTLLGDTGFGAVEWRDAARR